MSPIMHSWLRKSLRSAHPTPAAITRVTTRFPTGHARLFHATPARRISGEMVAIGALAAAWYLARKMKGLRIHVIPMGSMAPTASSVPPLCWLATCSNEVRIGVGSAVFAGNALASSQPEERRHTAFGEVTFAMPAQIARLNKDAPDFRLEPMGPCTAGYGEGRPRMDTHETEHSFNIEDDTRISLYYPDGAQQATAFFLAVNIEIMEIITATPKGQAIVVGLKRLVCALRLWEAQYKQWEKDSPGSITSRLKPGPIPVIVCFRNDVCGIYFHLDGSGFRRPEIYDSVFRKIHMKHPGNSNDQLV